METYVLLLHVINHSIVSTLSNCIIQGGGNGDFSALVLQTANYTLNNCTVTNSTSTCISSGSFDVNYPMKADSLVIMNCTTYGIQAWGSVTLTNSIIQNTGLAGIFVTGLKTGGVVTVTKSQFISTTCPMNITSTYIGVAITVNYCYFMGSTQPIAVNNMPAAEGLVTFNNNTIVSNLAGLYIQWANRLTMSANTFSNNVAAYAVSLMQIGQAVISNNVITGNSFTSFVMNISSRSSLSMTLNSILYLKKRNFEFCFPKSNLVLLTLLDITNNIAIGNGNYSIGLNAGNLTRNLFSNPTFLYELYFFGPYSTILPAQYNWWGSASSVVFFPRIADFFFLQTVGIVNWAPYLSQALFNASIVTGSAAASPLIQGNTTWSISLNVTQDMVL